MIGFVHVYPDRDLIEHELVGDGCVCGPDVEYADPETGHTYAHPLLTHHSLDGREQREVADGP